MYGWRRSSNSQAKLQGLPCLRTVPHVAGEICSVIVYTAMTTPRSSSIKGTVAGKDGIIDRLAPQKMTLRLLCSALA